MVVIDMKIKRNDTDFNVKQRKAAEMLVNPEFSGSVTELCREVGIARSTYYRWLDDPEYFNYISGLIDKYTNAELAAVWKALLAEAKKGNVSALKLYFELKGKYKQQVEVGGGVVFISGEDDIPE